MNYRTSEWRFRSVSILLLVLVASPVLAQQTEIINGRFATRDEILIRLRDSNPAAVARAQNAAPFGTVRPLSSALGLHLVRSLGNGVAGLLRAYANHPDVLYAEPNYVVQTATTAPNDSLFPSLWAMERIEAPIAWDRATGGTSAVIGVVDTGIDYTHPDLAANVWSAPSAFSVTIQGVPVLCPAGSHGFNAFTFSCDPRDDNNHGTHVSGTIAATGNNSLGVVGVNWRAQMMGLKFLNANGSGSVSGAINAIEFAIQVKARFAGTATPVDVRVLSNSWSGVGFSQSLLDAVHRANASDMLFVAAAGNNAANNDQTGVFPANFSTLAPNVISVAATDGGDGRAAFSNYGANSVQLGAPGVGIYSTVRGGGYAAFSGTSTATPHVAGAALLALSACPTLKTADLKNSILANVDPVGYLSGITTTGGRLNINRVLRSCSSSSTLKSTFVGANGEDVVGGVQMTPNGIADWRIQLEGLRGTPVAVTVTSAAGGVWATPFNGYNYIVAGNYAGQTGTLWIEPWGSGQLRVQVWYADGTTDVVDALEGTATAAVKASFLGVTGEDYVGAQLGANGVPDWHIRMQGLRSAPVGIRISSPSGGVWQTPFVGYYVVGSHYDGFGNADVWIEPWALPGFTFQVWYSDGTSDSGTVL